MKTKIDKKIGIRKFIFLFFITLFFISCSSAKIDGREKISKYFTMSEAISSTTAKKWHIKNIPNWEERSNIRYTARRLDEVREILGRPVIVTSWFRNKKLNKAVGGSKFSDHRRGLAVDIMLKKGKEGRKEFEKVRNKISSFDQLIYYPKRGHLHVGFKYYKNQERREVMIKY